MLYEGKGLEYASFVRVYAQVEYSLEVKFTLLAYVWQVNKGALEIETAVTLSFRSIL